MKDEELELRLREELRRRIVPGEPSDRLFAHVARLGLDEPAPAPKTTRIASRLRERMGLLGGLAAAAGIAAIVVAGLFWRADHGPIAATSSASASVGPSVSASPAVTPSETPAPSVTWTGLPVDVASYGALDATFGWVTGNATGQAEALYITDDGGSSWSQHQVPWTDPYNHSGIQYVDRLHAYVSVCLFSTAAGYTNTVLRSSDGGLTWARAVVLDHSGFYTYEFDMVDADHGWVLLVNNSGVWWLYGTTDGGVTWSPLVDTSKLSTAPRDLHFVSATEGWGYSKNGDLVHSLDGGKTWVGVALPVPAGYTITSQDAAPSGTAGNRVLHGFASQTGTNASVWVTWASADGGLTWRLDGSEQLSDVVSLQDQMDAAMGSGTLAGYGEIAGSNLGIRSAYGSLVLEGPDGQTSTFSASALYAFVPKGTTGMLMSAHATSAADAWVTIDTCAPADYFGSGMGFHPCSRLMATTDGGNTWRPMLWQPSAGGPTPTPVVPAAPPCCTMNPVSEAQRAREPLTGWLDATHGWAVVGTSLFWTADGGQTWDSGNPLPASGTIQFVDAAHGWLVASDSSNPGGTVYARTLVYRTLDGGKTWTSTDLPTNATDPNWTWSHFVDTTHGVVARCPQLIAAQDVVDCATFTTDDGGLTFQGPVTKTYATPIAWISSTVGYGIAYTMAAGADQESGPPLLKLTFDGGRTWTSQALETPSGSSVWLSPLAMELTPGGSGRLLVQFSYSPAGNTAVGRYETSDGGASWHLAWQASGSTVPVDTVRVAGSNLVGIAGTSFWVSSNFGQTWKKLANTPVEVHDFAFVDATTGWLVRAPGYSDSPDALMETTDGGQTWHVVLNAPSIITNP
jgi:photosystem II stability/assembly factor-like uncharacterized protein